VIRKTVGQMQAHYLFSHTVYNLTEAFPFGLWQTLFSSAEQFYL
jgi:hypothetical protein